MKNVVYTCPFVPAEWIAAHGLRPSRIMPSPEGGSPVMGPAEGFCPYALAFLRTVSRDPDAGAVILTTTCDQMRRAWDLLVRDSPTPAFLMNVPSTWQTVTAQQMYRDELKRLGGFLLRRGGRAPTEAELADVMLEYDAKRSALRDARGRLPTRQFSEAVARFHREGTVDLPSAETSERTAGVPVALIGGPMAYPQFGIFDLVERSGGRVALDATETGERTMPPACDRRAVRDDPVSALVDAYFGSIPDAFRRPNSLLYQWLEREMSARGIRGVIFRYYVWCDKWRAELQRMKEWLDVPLLGIAAEADEPVDAHTASRIEAFLEMLK